MLGQQVSDEQLYMKTKDGGRGLNWWIKEAWKQETRKECNSVKDEIILTMQTKGKTVQFEEEDMKLEEKILDRGFKPCENK